MVKKKKLKEIELPMKFNVGLQKYEPVLPTRKKPIKVERKGNNWAWWYLLISGAIILCEIVYGIIRHFTG